MLWCLRRGVGMAEQLYILVRDERPGVHVPAGRDYILVEFPNDTQALDFLRLNVVSNDDSHAYRLYRLATEDITPPIEPK